MPKMQKPKTLSDFPIDKTILKHNQYDSTSLYELNKTFLSLNYLVDS